MPKFIFRQAGYVTTADGGKIAFKVGENEVPAEFVEHPYVKEVADPADPVAEVAPVVMADPVGEVDEKSALIDEAEALGIDIDKRWGVARLRSEVSAKKVV